MNFERMAKQRRLLLVSAGVGLASMFLPWASIPGFSLNGMHGWGIVVFIGFITTGLLCLSGNQQLNLPGVQWMAILLTGAFSTLILSVNFLGSLDGLGMLGIGFYGALMAAACIAVFAHLHRSAGNSLQKEFENLKSKLAAKANAMSSVSNDRKVNYSAVDKEQPVNTKA